MEQNIKIKIQYLFRWNSESFTQEKSRWLEIGAIITNNKIFEEKLGSLEIMDL